MRLAIPLTMRTRTMHDGVETETEEDFYPNLEKPMKIVLMREGGYSKEYLPDVVGNVMTITDDGTLPVGTYQVSVLCYDQSNNPCRYMVRAIVKIVSATADAGIEAGIEFDAIDYVLDGAVFFYAKGDKGDPFTYEDFTPAQILDLKRPALEAAEVANQAATLANAKAEEARLAAINAKADYVGSDNYVYHWNAANQQYEKTDTYVKGTSVRNVKQIVTSTESGGVNVVRVNVEDGEHYDFEVRNGEKIHATVEGTTLFI